MNTEQNPEDDSARLTFLTGKAHQIEDLSLFEAKLVDDISENGERDLTPFERARADSMMKRFKEQRTK